MAELKPCKCPFCGDIERLIIEKATGGWPDDYYVHCFGCGAFGPSGNTEQQAIDAWNRREK